MQSRRTWVTGSGRAIACWVDEPAAGRAVGVVVSVPSFGLEAEDSYRAPRSLSVAAVEAGFVGVTMALTGEGDSQSLDGVDDLRAAWVGDVDAVLDFARTLVPDAPVHAVGLGLGASVVALASPPSGDGRLVCWEPVSGRQFLRKQTMLRKLAMEGELPPADVAVELPGCVLTLPQAASLKTIPAVRAGDRVHVRTEADRDVAAKLLDITSYYGELPVDSLHEIVADLPRGEQTSVRPWQPVLSARVGDVDGAVLTETFCVVPPLDLPGVRTQVEGAPARASVLFTAQGSERSSGPGSLWANEARRLVATRDVEAVRVDRRLTGGLIDPHAVREPNPFSAEAVEDVVAALDFARTDGVPIVGVGSCAGAWLLLRAAQDSMIDSVVAVSVPLWAGHVEVFDSDFLDRWHGPPPGVEAVDAEADPGRVRQVVRRGVTQARARLRPLRHAVRSARDAGGSPLLRAVPNRTAIHVLHGGRDAVAFTGSGGRLVAAGRRRRGGVITVRDEQHFEHSLRTAPARQAVAEVIDGALDAVIGRAPTPIDRRTAALH